MNLQQAQVSGLVNVAFLVLSLVVPRTQSSDDCLKKCETEYRFFSSFKLNSDSRYSRCARRCNNDSPISDVTSIRIPTTPTTATTASTSSTTSTTTTKSTTVPSIKEITTANTSTTSPTTMTTTTQSKTTLSTPKITTTKFTTEPATTTTTTTTSTLSPNTTTQTTFTTLPTTVTTSTSTTKNISSVTTTSSSSDLRYHECGMQREGLHSHRQRIIGGFPADRCEYPWLVLIIVSNMLCGGAIIDNRHILTAAHCLKDRNTSVDVPPMNITVVHLAGNSSLSKGMGYKVTNVTTHASYNIKAHTYDIGVLTIRGRFVFTECLRPVCLPETGSEPADNSPCIVAGWGTTNYSEPNVSLNLMEVEVPIVNRKLCQTNYGTSIVNELIICAGHFWEGGKDACQGDSGGPLICKNGGRFVVHGIVSTGRGCALPYYPGIYTRVDHSEFKAFIKMATSIG